MRASIIVPSYNACERLYYNLLSLNMQSFDRNDFEVIIVDNASRDDTKQLLLSFKADFNLKPIFLNENKGRSYARNRAIDKSKGEILIFHDSDMIAEKDYISKHIAAHSFKNTVVIGQNWSRIYTYYYKDFKGYLKDNFVKQQEQMDKHKCQQYANAQAIIGKEEILNGKCFEHTFKLHKFLEVESSILKCFGRGLEGYRFPWSLFATNNCSAFKEDIINSGAFDEAFITWGCEDLDLGYRLYKNGCKFIKDNDIVSIHQEHPIDFMQNGMQNVYYFTNKYNTIDILLFYYGHLADIRKQRANTALGTIERLNNKEKFKWFIELYRLLLVNLRDRSYGIDKSKALHESKRLRGYISDKSEMIKETMSKLDMDMEYKIINYSFRVLLKRSFGPYLDKLNL